MARIKLGDLMVKAGLIDDLQLQSALALQRQWGGKLGDILVTHGFIDEMMLWKGLSKQLGVPLVSLPNEPLPAAVETLLPVELCHKHSIFPIAKDATTLTVATSDPSNVGGLDEIAFRVGGKLKVVLAPDREIEWAIRRVYNKDPSPCPPPQTKRIIDQSAPLDVEHERQKQPKTMTPQPSGASMLPTTAEAELSIRETAHLLRYVVDVCVQRGVFTREQYLAKLKSL